MHQGCTQTFISEICIGHMSSYIFCHLVSMWEMSKSTHFPDHKFLIRWMKEYMCNTENSTLHVGKSITDISMWDTEEFISPLEACTSRWEIWHTKHTIFHAREMCALTFHVKWWRWPNWGKMICTISWMNYRGSIFHVGRICAGTVKREIKIMASHMWECLGTVLDLERNENFQFNEGKRVPWVSTGFHIFT